MYKLKDFLKLINNKLSESELSRKWFCYILICLFLMVNLTGCTKKIIDRPLKIIFLHHSTGQNIWDGNRNTLISRAIGRIAPKYSYKFFREAHLPELFEKHNNKTGTNYIITEQEFPKDKPYGWNNDPYDYYNIWVKNAGEQPYLEEPTLEILTKEYNVIIFKHCFPVSNIQADRDTADINSSYKSLSNYKMQYLALREKLQQFPGTKFILFTGAAQVRSQVTPDEAKRAKEFFTWVINEWDKPGDNIYIWDLYSLETKGDLYLKNEYARGENDSHPNNSFSRSASKLLFNRIIDVINNEGKGTEVTGEIKIKI